MQNNESDIKLFKIYAAVAVLFLAVLAFIPPLSDHSREWKKYQRQFFKMEAQKTVDGQKKEKLENVSLEIKQIIVEDMNRVDRCTTCHMGISNPDYKDAVQPFRTHPNYDQHPFDKFGCTICHAGQGRATTVNAAHGHVEFWEAPMLPIEYIQSSCGKCHFSQDIPGAPDLSEGIALFKKKRCIRCHKVGNKGGNRGPDLTREGRFGHRDPDWLFKHFKDPKAVVPDSSMPNYHFTNKEAKAITMYMLSLTDEKITGYLSSKKIIPDISTGKTLFMEKGCIGCHSIRGKGGNVGPDLTHVSKRRDTDWIFRHFKEPQKVSPGTVMPKFGFTDDEARALTMFVLSLSEEDVVGFIKKPK